MKRILVLNGGWAEVPLIEEAKKLGCYVITTGKRPELPGHSYANEYIAADYSDKEAILSLVKEHEIDGIISNAHDFGIVTAAYVAEKMGWDGHDTYENAMILHEKDLFKAFLKQNEILSPYSHVFEDKTAAMQYLESAEYPLIVKATDQTSGIGISKATTYEEGRAAVTYAFENSRKNTIVIEPYIIGEQESIVAFVVNKNVKCVMACDCYSPINPYLIQTETMPSRNFSALKSELCGIIERIFRQLNLVDGIVTLQYIVRDGRPYIIELMRRCLGNQFLEPVSVVTGFPWFKALVMSELGMDCSQLQAETPSAKFAGWHGIMAQKNGVFQEIEIPAEIKEHIYKEFQSVRAGDIITDYNREKLSFIYYTYDDRKALDNAATGFNDFIKVKVNEVNDR